MLFQQLENTRDTTTDFENLSSDSTASAALLSALRSLASDHEHFQNDTIGAIQEIGNLLQVIQGDVATSIAVIPKVENLSVKIGANASEIVMLQGDLNSLSDSVDSAHENARIQRDHINSVSAEMVHLNSAITSIKDRLADLENQVDSIGRFLSGTLRILPRSKDEPILVKASELNEAVADSFTVTIKALLQSGNAMPAWWANFAPVITASKGTVADGDVLDPTIDGDPAFVDGEVEIPVIIDTDEGATKTYVADEEMTVTIQASGDDTYMGHSVDSVDVTIKVV